MSSPAACYAAGDVFVFASRTETQGLVLLEALALGVPVVALATLGTREIVLPQRGACPAPGDPAGFAAVVAELIRDPERRARMREAGPVFAAEWDTGVTARRLIAVYEDLRSRGAARRRVRYPRRRDRAGSLLESRPLLSGASTPRDR